MAPRLGPSLGVDSCRIKTHASGATVISHDKFISANFCCRSGYFVTYLKAQPVRNALSSNLGFKLEVGLDDILPSSQIGLDVLLRTAMCFPLQGDKTTLIPQP